MSLACREEKSQAQVDAVVERLAGTSSSLAACSLVSKRWHARCRQQRFRRAKLADLDDLRSSGWSLDSDDIHLGNHSSNHSTQCGGELWVCSSMPRHLSHFGPLSSIASLTLDHVAITHFHSPTLQHTFRDLVPTVTNLRLLHPTACPTSLLRFITIFGNLQVITIHAPSWAVLDHNTPAVHCGQFRGTLYLSEFDDDSNDFISLLELHAAGTKRITISKCNFRDLRPLQWFLSSAAQSIQNLHVIVDENGDVPELSLQDCTVLEHVIFDIVGSTVSFPRISTLISSIASQHFRSLVLKLRTTAQREHNAIQDDLVDRISDLDRPLSSLGRVASARNQKISLVLLGQDPEFLAQGLVDFQEVGYVWAGDEVDENSYSWTFTSPKSRTKRCGVSISDWLFRRETRELN